MWGDCVGCLVVFDGVVVVVGFGVVGFGVGVWLLFYLLVGVVVVLGGVGV